MSNRQTNLDAIAIVARGLGDLLESVAFVGGAVVTLYIDDPAAEDVRATKDVDCVIEVSGHGGLADLEQQLRRLGFVNATEPGAPICRWHFSGLIVDVMPTDSSILGFSNRWYPEAMKNLRTKRVAPDVEVFVFSLPYFVASKLEAFETRGKRDWLASHDLEDVIRVLDTSSSIETDLCETTGELRTYLNDELGRLAHHADAAEILAAHLTPGSTTDARVKRMQSILGRLIRS